MNSLTTTEQSELAKCEKTISAGMASFVEVGAALIKIRDAKLYRVGFKTFEAYVKEKWGMARARAYQLIDASETVSNLSNMLDKPENARQAAELAKLPAADQSAAWRKALDTAPDGKVTAKHVAEVVKQEKEEAEPKQWISGGVPITPAEHRPEDDDEDAVFILKRDWRAATKKQRRLFLEWVDEQPK